MIQQPKSRPLWAEPTLLDPQQGPGVTLTFTTAFIFSELWMETVETKYTFTVKAVALKNLDLWPVSLFHRGKKWAHSGNVFAVKKQRRNELFKLERGLILEICPQITLNAPLCIKKQLTLQKTSVIRCVFCEMTQQTAFKLQIWDCWEKITINQRELWRANQQNQLPCWHQHLRKPMEAFWNFWMEM